MDVVPTPGSLSRARLKHSASIPPGCSSWKAEAALCAGARGRCCALYGQQLCPASGCQELTSPVKGATLLLSPPPAHYNDCLCSKNIQVLLIYDLYSGKWKTYVYVKLSEISTISVMTTLLKIIHIYLWFIYFLSIPPTHCYKAVNQVQQNSSY